MKRNFSSTLLPLILFLLLLPPFAFTEEKNKPLRVAALIHLTGEYAQAGKAFREGILLATDEINKTKKRKIDVIFEDTQYNMKTVNTLSQRALFVDKVSAAIVSNYTEVMVAGPAFERAKVPLITLWDSSPEIEELGSHVFGIGVWAPSTSQVAVDYARKKKAKTAITIATNGQWSLAVAESFSKQFQESGGKILKEMTVNPGDTDFRSISAKISQLKPDVLYAPLSDHQIPFWKHLRSSGYNGIRITSDILNQAIIDELGPVSNGILQTQVADPENDSTRQMLKKYKERYKTDCKQIFLTSLGYDAIHIISEATENISSPTSAEISKHLYSIKSYQGAAGETTINAKGSARKSASMFVVTEGKLQKIDS